MIGMTVASSEPEQARVSVVLPRGMLVELRRIAAAQERTVSQLLRYLAAQEIERYRGEESSRDG